MAEPLVYIETTIPSFYCTTRTDPESAARKNWTQHWWDFKRDEYRVVTSEAVCDEISRGTFPTRNQALAILEGITLVPVVEEVLEIVETYIQRRVMPANALGDALHLALASYHKCDFLLTWNCKHLANANKFQHIQRVNTMLGIMVPSLVTPLELLGEED